MVQLDAAGLLFLLFITGVSISMAPSPSDPSTQRFWLAGLMHALPLLTMLNIPWLAPPPSLQLLMPFKTCSPFYLVLCPSPLPLHAFDSRWQLPHRSVLCNWVALMLISAMHWRCGLGGPLTAELWCRYMCNRERVLGAYLVCSAFHAVYLSGRAALHLEPQSALAALVWFSRVQAAEPLLFHAVMFAVRQLSPLQEVPF